MQPGYTERRRKQTLKFVVVFALVAALSLLTWLTLKVTHVLPGDDNLVMTDTVMSVQQNNVLMQDEILHERLNTLHKLDEEYSLLFTDPTNKTGLAEINARISAEEQAFGKLIDSVSKESPSIPNKTNESFFVHMVMSFRSVLQNRLSISNLRKAISNNNTVLDPGQRELFQLQNELLAKDTKIANLETALKAMQNSNAAIKQPVVNTSMVLENTSLKEKVLSNDTRIASLTATNASLKRDYDRVVKQLSDATNTAANDQSAKTQNVSLENKIDELNTELRLAHVDCNLSRVDAKQIISNAKQRKILLSEALSILNSLSKSDNASIQRKVQQKINQLNQIATNYRD